MKQTGFRVCANCKSVRCAPVVRELRRFKMAAAFMFWPGSQSNTSQRTPSRKMFGDNIFSAFWVIQRVDFSSEGVTQSNRP